MCRVHIHDPDMTLNFDLKGKFIGFLTCFRVRLFLDWHWVTIFSTWVYHHTTMCRVHIHDPDTTLNFDLKVNANYRVFDMFSCPAHNSFLDWQWLTIFGTWVYHHKTMCCLHLWSRFDVYLRPQGQIYRFLSCLNFLLGLTLAYHIRIESIIIRKCVKYIHDLERHWTLTSMSFYRVYDIALCSGLSFFVLWHSHTLFGTCFVCLFLWSLMSNSRIFHSYGDGEGLQISTYARYLLPLSIKGSLTCHILCNTGLPFIIVISEVRGFADRLAVELSLPVFTT